MSTGTAVLILLVLVAVCAVALALMWRLYTDSARRATEALDMVHSERARSAEHQAALRRYEVTFASITGRGELGEQVLVETATRLGLREGVHFELQADLAGGGAARPDMVLNVGGTAGQRRQIPVDAKTSLTVWAEAMETDDPDERADALQVHVRAIRSRATELASKGYERWADALYGSIMFVPSDAAVIAALDHDKSLLGWLLGKRVFLCGPTGFAVLASAALVATTEQTLAADAENVRAQATRATRAAGNALDAVNLSSTHLQRFLSARRRELDALEQFRASTQPLAEATGTTELTAVRLDEEVAARSAVSSGADSAGASTNGANT